MVSALLSCGGNDLVLPGETSAADLALIAGNDQRGPAGAELASPLVVKVLDRRGQPLSNQRVAFSLGAEVPGAAISPDTAETGGDGMAEARWVLGSASGTQTAVARVVGADGLEVTFNASVDAASSSRVEMVSGDDQAAQAGTALSDPLIVRVTDHLGNPLGGVAVAWSAQQGSVSPTSTLTGEDGQAATSWMLGSSTGSQSASASSPGLQGSPIAFTATATSGGPPPPPPSASRLAFRVQPSDTEEDERISPAVEVVVLDQAGNPVTQGEFEVTLELRGSRGRDRGDLEGDRTQRTESGVATFDDLRVDREGDYRLRASTDGLPSVDSDEFDVDESDNGD
jgi:hypothetical protein